VDRIGAGDAAEQTGIWIAHGLGEFDQVDRFQCRVDQPQIGREAMQAKPDQRHLTIAGQTGIAAAPPPVAADQSRQKPRQLQAPSKALGSGNDCGYSVVAVENFGCS
jgi:hypothetical protein